jgi:hypothetical protein
MEISCPVSAERVNESVVRIIALLVAIIAVVCIAFGNYYAMIFLMIDFAIRAFTTGKWSVLKAISVQLFKVFKFPIKMTDLAPKKFAAKVGFVFCLLISGIYLLQFDTAALVLISILLIFAILESIFAICVGCHVYSFWQMVKNKK